MSKAQSGESMLHIVRQSPPIDTSQRYDPRWVAGKTILITGGASGFGEGFFRKWAEAGANVIIGDINDKRGEQLVAEIRQATGNDNHHYIHCDVTDWQSQVDFFRNAVNLSPRRGIDSVVVNAGISDFGQEFEKPQGLDGDAPPKPKLRTFEVNMVGALYTTHLAIFWLAKNPGSKDASISSDPTSYTPDRHILLVGSIASMNPLPGEAMYNVAKHGVLGLFRSLRGTLFTQGIRINMVCPYFIDTPLIIATGRVLLAGSAIGKPADVVDAGTRFMADSRIAGRALAVGPKVRVSLDDAMEPVPETKDGRETAVWETYADDWEECEVFNRRFVKILNYTEGKRGIFGLLADLFFALLYAIRSSWTN
jgi:NAD(P)-dependent dehydrogenase (short-subunit alcohol dehydrogenase family)